MRQEKTEGQRVQPKSPVVYNQFNERETNGKICRKSWSLPPQAHRRLEIWRIRKKFLSAFTEEVNALDFSIPTEKQIDQNIRDELKAVKKYVWALKSEQSKTGGDIVVLPRMIRTQKFVFEALENKPRITGTHGGQEIGSCLNGTAYREQMVEDIHHSFD